MLLTDTILAVASAPGRSPRALIRMSGPATHGVLAHVCEAPAAPAQRLRLAPTLSLPVLITRFRAPRSYTGQDAAEILLPGNPALLERVLQRLAATGEPVRLAGPGEFTARAYLNGKLTLDEAEGVAAVVGAQTNDDLRAAQELLTGRTGALYRAWAAELTTLLALVEAGIDFTDQEDVVPIAPADLARRIDTLVSRIGAHLGPERVAEVSRTLARVVLAGRPNAGKSTLFNTLLGRPRAVVSPTPGTTRDALEEVLDLTRDLPGAGPVLLIDLAGLDGGPLDTAAQRRALDAIGRAHAIIHCDPAGRFEPLPGVAAAVGGVEGHAGVPVIRVRTKADLPAPEPGGDIAVCALDGWNIPSLRRAIADVSGRSGAPGSGVLLPRHRRALLEAADRLRAAGTQIDPESPRLPDPALVADALRGALDALAELTGRVAPDDVLARIFATFCVGK